MKYSTVRNSALSLPEATRAGQDLRDDAAGRGHEALQYSFFHGVPLIRGGTT